MYTYPSYNWDINVAITTINMFINLIYRLQLSRNLRDSPGFVASVLDHGRPHYGYIVCPRCWPDSTIH